MKPVHVGCSGWNYAHWREVVYPKGLPPKRWLEHYATLFDTVEVNTQAAISRSPTGARRWRCSPTSTTTGTASPSATDLR